MLGKFVKLFALAVVIGVLAGPQVALAQSNISTGQILGETNDAAGGVLPGVTVQATNVDTGLSRRAITNPDGSYRIDLLPPGTYEVRADLAGFKSEVKRGVTVALGSAVNMTFLLQASAIEEEIVVTAEAPVIETSNPSVSSSVSDQQIGNLPLQGRDFSDFAILAPGTSTADGSQQSGRGGLQMGARAIQNSFNIDGSNNQSSFFGEQRGGTRPPFTFSQAAIKEFQVIKSSYNLQFNSSGGVINAITKSGTNILAGQVFAYYTDDSMRATDANGEEASTYEQTQFGFALGGPVIQDKLHFFLSYDGQRYTTPYFATFSGLEDVYGDVGDLFPDEASAIAAWESRTGLDWDTETGQIDQTNDADVFLVKLDWQASDSHLATARLNRSEQTGDNLTSSFENTGRSNNGTEDNSFISLVASLNSVLSEDMFNEAIFQYSSEERPRAANNETLPETSISGFLADWGRQDYLPNSLDEVRFQLVDNLSYYLGDHTLKAGLNYENVSYDNVYFRYRYGQYVYAGWEAFFNDEPQSYQQAFSPYNGQIEFDVDFYALYLQDEWRVSPGLTVTYGLRYDLQDNPTPDLANPGYPDTAQIPDDTDNIAPRIGFAWDISGDGKSVLRGGAGYFYDITPTLMLSNAMNDNGLRVVTIFNNCSQGAECPDQYPEIWADQGDFQLPARPSIKVMDPDFENAQTWRVSLGYERELLTDLSVGLDLIYSETDKLERSQNQNVIPDGGTTADGTPTYDYNAVYPNFTEINQYTSDVEAEYTAAVVKTRKRFSNGWMFDASYTWSDAKDSDSNERATTSYPWDQYNLDLTWGPSDFDTTHKVVVSGSYLLPWDFMVSGIYSYRSGFPYTGVGRTDTNGDNQRVEPALIDNGDGTFTRLERNSFNHPSFSTFDLRLSKAFRFGRSMAVEILFDVFNVLDEDNRWVSSANRNYYNSNGSLNANFGVAGEVGVPRSYQVGAKFTF